MLDDLFQESTKKISARGQVLGKTQPGQKYSNWYSRKGLGWEVLNLGTTLPETSCAFGQVLQSLPLYNEEAEQD